MSDWMREEWDAARRVDYARPDPLWCRCMECARAAAGEDE